MEPEGISTLWILFGIAIGAVANAKGRSFWLWAVYGWFLNPIALFHAIVLKAKVKCPMCAEMVNPDALFCRFCGFIPEAIVDVPATACPSCGARMGMDADRCSRCGYRCSKIPGPGPGPKGPAPTDRHGTTTIEVVPSEPKAVVALAKLCSFCGKPARGETYQGHQICGTCRAAAEPLPEESTGRKPPGEVNYVRGIILTAVFLLAVGGALAALANR